MDKQMHPHDSSSEHWVVVGEIRSDVKHLLLAAAKQADNVHDLRHELKKDMRAMDDRLNKVEAKQWTYAGYIGLLAFAIPLIIALIGWSMYG